MVFSFVGVWCLGWVLVLVFFGVVGVVGFSFGSFLVVWVLVLALFGFAGFRLNLVSGVFVSWCLVSGVLVCWLGFSFGCLLVS